MLPDRSDTLDALAETFDDSPAEYGPVPLWWLDGEDLDDERLTEQLEALADNGVPAVCFISKLPNGPDGTTPRYFTEEWWSHMEHVAAECDRLGMELWVHDETYHHSPPSWWGFWQDHIRTEATGNEAVRGRVLHREAADAEDGEAVTLELPREFEALAVAAYPRDNDGRLRLEDAVDLEVEDGRVEWPGENGAWHVAVVGTRPEGLCYTSEAVVERYIDLHYQEYVRRLGDLVGDVLVGTFEDELEMLNDEIPCDERVLERFREERGYDPTAELIALYEDCDATARVRTDYYDVVVSLLEENWFEPLYEWHEEHGLKRAHDNWGRNNITAGTEQYGDYYRTMRWYQVPGYDDGGPEAVGDRNLFDAKLSASIAACYDRERVWGELFHSTSWGFRPATQLAGLIENVCYGCSLYDNHGLYYTTRGGWWAHAPPDVHFRQPYWEDVTDLNDAATRLSMLFSEGTPVVDAALAFPVASMHADWHPEDGVGDLGNDVDARTRELVAELYGDGSDLIVADVDSLAGAAADGHLEISGMEIPALVLPPLSAVRPATLETALELFESGGVVVASGRLPATVAGEANLELEATLETLFGEDYAAGQRGEVTERTVTEHDSGGVGVLAPDDADASEIVRSHVRPDVRVDAEGVYHTHRTVADGDAEVYLLFNARDETRTVRADLRTSGRLERWDPLTGETAPIREFGRIDQYAEFVEGYTRVEVDFDPHGFEVIVVDAAANVPRMRVTESDIAVTGLEGTTVRGYAASGGEKRIRATDGNATYVDSVRVPAPTVHEVSDGWAFDLRPTMDNEWADFRYPESEGSIGPEVRAFAHRQEGPDEDGIDRGWHEAEVDTDGWDEALPTYGPGFYRKTGSVAEGPGGVPGEPDAEGWEPYEFSREVGKPGTHPYLMGYMSTVSDNYLVSPDEDADERANDEYEADERGADDEREADADEYKADATYFWTTVRVPEPGTYLCHFGAGVTKLRLGDREIDPDDEHSYDWLRTPDTPGAGDTVSVRLPAGSTEVLLTVEPGVETFFAFDPEPGTAHDRELTHTPRLRWFYGEGQGEAVFDTRPDEESVGWYRFEVPAGTRAFSVPVEGEARVWVDGEEQPVADDCVELDAVATEPTPVAVRVAQPPGAYGGAAWTGPAEIDTETVTVDAGDWRDLSLESYSGRAVYRRTISLPDVEEGDRVVLGLGDVVAAASVRVNGEPVGSTFSPPYELDVTEAVEPGENEIEVEVGNTLANHFATETPRVYREIPLGWLRGADPIPEMDPDEQFAGGLRGPVTVRVEPGVEVDLEPR